MTTSDTAWLLDFIDARCSFQTNGVTAFSDLRRAYEEWIKERGGYCVSQRALGMALTRLPKIQATRTSSTRQYQGIVLKKR